MSDHPLFTLASSWETVEADARPPLKEFITKLVGYPCQLSCQPNNGSIDIYVFSVEKKKITDWLELQPDGAIGVIYYFYKGNIPHDLDDRCEDHNAALDVVFESGSDTDSDSSSF
jgi:hypothetical protein